MDEIDERLDAMDDKIHSMDRNMFMTLRGIMTLMDDLMFATMPSEGFTPDQKVRLMSEQIQARQRVQTTLEAMKKVMG